MMQRFIMLGVIIAALTTGTQSHAANIVLSTETNATLNGASFQDGDLVFHSDDGSNSNVIFNENNFAANEDIDALHLQADGSIVFSTRSAASLNGTSFRNGDIVRFNPNTGAVSVIFSESLFNNNENIDAVSFDNQGNILFSTSGFANLNGTAIRNGDIVSFDPLTGNVEIIFSEDLFADNENIDAIHFLENGNLLLSTTGNAVLAGLAFSDGDIVEFNPTTGEATLFFDEANFGSNEDIDAIFVRVPVTNSALLMTIGLLALRRRQSRG